MQLKESCKGRWKNGRMEDGEGKRDRNEKEKKWRTNGEQTEKKFETRSISVVNRTDILKKL